MSSSLSEVIATRRRRAVQRAAALAEKLDTGDSRSVAAQAEVEQALVDLRHYSALEGDLAEVADDLGTYNRHSKRSILADLRDSGSAGAKDRIDASNRAAADEHRDFGVGTAIAAVPDWLIAESRPMAILAAPLVTSFSKPLPARSGLVLKLPQFSTEPAGGPQAALNSALPTAQFADDGATGPVRTFGCQVDVALQVLHQSPVAVDRHVLPALVAATDAAVEKSIYTGTGTNGHVVGVLNTNDISTATYTSTAPTLVGMITHIEGLVRDVETAGGSGGHPVVLVHPRRLSWLRETASTEKVDLGWTRAPVNGATCGLFGGTVSVVADPAIPTDQGAGTNEDVIVVMRNLDVIDLYVSPPRVRVHDAGSAVGTLTAKVTVSRMVAFTADRLPAAVGVLSGTGLSDPD